MFTEFESIPHFALANTVKYSNNYTSKKHIIV